MKPAEKSRPLRPATLEASLQLFNRKERFILLEQSVTDLDRMRLGASFASRLSETLNDDVPAGAFIAMDYHLNWLYAALHHWSGTWSTEATHVHRHQSPGVLRNNQEDVDLIVCWGDRLLLIEAKAYTGWSNKQMTSKVKRLDSLFPFEGNAFPQIEPSLVLAGFKSSSGLNTKKWPSWAKGLDGKPYFVSLIQPELRLSVGRCDLEGKSTAEGQYWKTRSHQG